MGNAVEHRDLASDDVVGLHVGGRRVVAGALRRQRNDEEILENPSGVARLQRVACLAPQRHAQIHSAVLAERRNRFAGLGVDGRQVSGIQIQQPLDPCGPCLPVVEPPRADRALVRMAPQLLSRRRIERDDRVAGALCIITLSTTIGLNVIFPATGYVQATSSCEMLDLLIWSSAEYCDEWAPP